MIQRKYLANALIGGVAVLFGGAQVIPGAHKNTPLVSHAISVATGGLVTADTARTDSAKTPAAPTISKLANAIGAFQIFWMLAQSSNGKQLVVKKRLVKSG